MGTNNIKDKDVIIDRVKKLLNLADKDKNNSDAEAEAALLMAQKLMAEHDISIDMRPRRGRKDNLTIILF